MTKKLLSLQLDAGNFHVQLYAIIQYTMIIMHS